MTRDVFFQVQEAYDKDLVASKSDRVRSLLANGHDVRMTVKMQGSQILRHDHAMVLVERIASRVGYLTPPVLSLDIPNGSISTIFKAERGT